MGHQLITEVFLGVMVAGKQQTDHICHGSAARWQVNVYLLQMAVHVCEGHPLTSRLSHACSLQRLHPTHMLPLQHMLLYRSLIGPCDKHTTR